MANELGYLNIYNMINSNGNLWKICEIAAIKAALDVLNESPTTAHHNERTLWAHGVIGSPSQWVANNKIRFMLNATIRNAGDSATDSDVQAVVNQLVPV